MRSLHRPSFVKETGSSFRILEVCWFPYWQFSGSGDHIFQQISTKSHISIKFSNADLVFSGEWNRKQKSDCRDVQPDLISIRYYVHNSSPVFTKFRMRFRNVVDSTPAVCETNRKYVAEFRDVRIPILAVFGLWWPHLSTDQHQIPCTDKIRQRRLCIQINDKWNRKLKSDFRDVQIPDLNSIRYYVHNSSAIFTKCCMQLRNVVASTLVVCGTNRM